MLAKIAMQMNAKRAYAAERGNAARAAAVDCPLGGLHAVMLSSRLCDLNLLNKLWTLDRWNRALSCSASATSSAEIPDSCCLHFSTATKTLSPDVPTIFSSRSSPTPGCGSGMELLATLGSSLAAGCDTGTAIPAAFGSARANAGCVSAVELLGALFTSLANGCSSGMAMLTALGSSLTTAGCSSGVELLAMLATSLTSSGSGTGMEMLALAVGGCNICCALASHWGSGSGTSSSRAGDGKG
mmetsp:Transcript_16952/g.36733  ORF Transcript_16952/g.36733 Transcript_16952/m.36733 type:complete len:242 (-) Transcript_16952:306-1031(-)